MIFRIGENEGGFATDAIKKLILSDRYTALDTISDVPCFDPTSCKDMIILFNSHKTIPEIKNYSVQSACITLTTSNLLSRHYICGFICKGEEYIFDSAGNGDATGDHTNSIFEKDKFTSRPQLPEYLKIKNEHNTYKQHEQYLIKQDYIYDFIIYFKNR